MLATQKNATVSRAGLPGLGALGDARELYEGCEVSGLFSVCVARCPMESKAAMAIPHLYAAVVVRRYTMGERLSGGGLHQ